MALVSTFSQAVWVKQHSHCHKKKKKKKNDTQTLWGGREGNALVAFAAGTA